MEPVPVVETAVWVVYIGLFAGMFIRAVGPYMVKVVRGETSKFDFNYLKSTGAAVVLFMLTVPFSMPEVPAGVPWYSALFFAAMAGYSLPSFIQHMKLPGSVK